MTLVFMGLIVLAFVMYHFFRIDVAIFSFLAAAGSCYVACAVKNINSKKDEAKFRSDLYFITNNLICTDNYLQALYDIRDIATKNDAMIIMDVIKIANKNIIDTTNMSFYNDKLEPLALKAVSKFIRQYNLWKSWTVVREIDIFKEIKYIYQVRISLLLTLKELEKNYLKDRRFEKIICPIQYMNSSIKNVCQSYRMIGFIYENLSTIFYTKLFLKKYTADEKCNIVANLLQKLISKRMNSNFIKDNEVICFLFNKEISEINIDFGESKDKEIPLKAKINYKDIIIYLDKISKSN